MAETPRRAFLSVSKEIFARLKQRSEETGAPISVLVELAISQKIGAPLSPTAKQWLDRLLPAATAKKTSRKTAG